MVRGNSNLYLIALSFSQSSNGVYISGDFIIKIYFQLHTPFHWLLFSLLLAELGAAIYGLPVDLVASLRYFTFFLLALCI